MRRRFDLQDYLLVLGTICLIGGIGAIYMPAGMIALGLLLLGLVNTISRAKQAAEQLETNKKLASIPRR